ncbi:DUF2236 domain-containing protein [Micromonospora sp. BRA006-A]|nr:DUF2236 domain-containing protein [Micromonospora sp. BRA006-A]
MAMARAGRYRWLRRIETLDPVRDHHEIYRLSAGYEFPFDYQRALELALLRTYCVPSISALLDATGEFRLRAQRADDTALLMAELLEHGYDSPRGREALRVVNRAHGRFAISNDDMRYVLSTFVYEPIDWLDRYGWRPLHEHERLAAFHYYRAVGARASGTSRRTSTRSAPSRTRTSGRRSAARRATSGSRRTRWICSRPGTRHRCARPRGSRCARCCRPRCGPPSAAGRATSADRAGRRRAARRAAVVRLLPARTVSRLTRAPRNRTYPGYPRGTGPPTSARRHPARHRPGATPRRAPPPRRPTGRGRRSGLRTCRR